jgi:8-oxo-dGTP diphosphatase
MPKELIYCPICGHTLGSRQEGGRLRKACDNCGYVHYVNPVPAVGLLIEHEGGLVLIRRLNPPHRGQWSLPSGFIEADEGAEDAAMREAEEETGLKTEIIEMFGVNSFPEGPPISGIMLFYRLRPIGGELRGGDDAIEAKVFQIHELPLLPFRTHREAVAQWLTRQATTDETPMVAADAQDFYIRAAELSDSRELMALLAMIPANRDLRESDWREIYQRFRESRDLETFVAVTRQSPPMVIGFLSLSVFRTLTEGRGLINDMSVLPTYQRRGVGAALLEAAMRRAERLDLCAISVNVSRANERGRAFYASLGFGDVSQMEIRIKKS